MKRNLLAVLGALLAALVTSGPAKAQDAATKSLLERYERRIADLETRLSAWTPDGVVPASGGVAVGGGACSGPGCNTGCDNGCNRGSIDAGVEFTFLRGFHSNGVQGANGTDLNFGLECEPRYWIGYTGANGVGFRARYWEYDHIASRALANNAFDSLRYDTYILDLEITGVERLSDCWELAWSGGFRYNEFEERQHAVSGPTAPGGQATTLAFHSFDSWNMGPVVGAEVRRYLRPNLALFVNGRTSLMFGDENEFFQQGVLGDREQDNVRAILEMQLGGEWSRPLANGGRLFFRGAFEAQYWPNYSGEAGFDGGEAIGFAGFVVGAGIRY